MLSIALAIIASGTINRESVLTIYRNAGVLLRENSAKSGRWIQRRRPYSLPIRLASSRARDSRKHNLPGHCQRKVIKKLDFAGSFVSGQPSLHMHLDFFDHLLRWGGSRQKLMNALTA